MTLCAAEVLNDERSKRRESKRGGDGPGCWPHPGGSASWVATEVAIAGDVYVTMEAGAPNGSSQARKANLGMAGV